MQHNKKNRVIARLRIAEGHIQAVIRMAETDESCEQVLHQLLAVEAALRAASCLWVENHLQSKQEIIRGSHNPNERTRALDQLLSIYQLLSKQSI